MKYKGFDLIPKSVLAKRGDPAGWSVFATYRNSTVHLGDAVDLKSAKRKVDRIIEQAERDVAWRRR